MRLSRSVLLLLLPLAGTSGWEDVAAQQVVTRRTAPVFRLGGPDAPEAYAFAALPRLVVDTAGRIYARVASEATVRVFAPDGRFVRTIGRKGRGPGEFDLAAAHGLLGDTLWIRNWPAPRISRFLIDGTHIATTGSAFDFGRRFAGSTTGITALLAQGRAFVTETSSVLGVTERIRLPAIVGPFDMTSRDTIALLLNPTGLWIPQVGTWTFDPMPAAPLVSVASNGAVVAVADWSDREPGALDLRLIAADGTQRWRRRLRFDAPAIPRTVRDSLIDVAMEKARQPVEAERQRGTALAPLRALVETGLALPQHYPPIRRVIVGVDGTLWLEQTAALRGSTWVVLDRNGDILFQVQTPSGFRVDAATTTSLWGTQQDELGVAYMTKLSIVER